MNQTCETCLILKKKEWVRELQRTGPEELEKDRRDKNKMRGEEDGTVGRVLERQMLVVC